MPTDRSPAAAPPRPGIIRISLAVATSLFLAWQSAVVFDVLLRIRPDSWWLLALIAWLFNMGVTGAFAVVGFVLPTHRVLPEGYYRVRRPRRLKAAYRALRVDLFGWVLLATLWRDRAQRRRYFDGTASGLEHLDQQSRSSEFGHAVPFVLVTAASVAWALSGAAALAGLAIGFNVLGNLYPVLLQRHHRMRVQRLRSRARGRAGEAATFGAP